MYTPRKDCQIPNLADIYQAHFPTGTGRFVEVGAFDGVTYSNTVFLAEAGWEGLYVEPNPVQAENCRLNHASRPGIKVAEFAVSNYDGEAELYDIGECSTLVWDKTAINWGGDINRKFRVKCKTLDHILEDAVWKPGFELLVIDVENNEVNVLTGFDCKKWSPRMVIIEAHEKDGEPSRSIKSFAINTYFTNAGYQKVQADHINSIFVR